MTSRGEQSEQYTKRKRQLRGKWTDRDTLYRAQIARGRRRSLSPAEIEGIRSWRWHEAAELGDVDMMLEAETYTGVIVWT